MNNVLDICYASSDEFSEYTGISMLSLLYHNKDININKIYLLDYGIFPKNKVKIQTIANKYKKNIIFIDALSILEKYKTELKLKNFSGSLATYSRAFLDLILPLNANRILYIDSDTIIIGKLNELVDLDMTGKVMAAVIGYNQYPYPNEPSNNEIYLINGNTTYYACGVILYNLDNWRKNACNKYICEVCKENLVLPYADQTLINNALPETFLMQLHPKYNYWGHIFPKHRERHELRRGKFLSDKEIKEEIDNPIIIHYKGLQVRPWYSGTVSRRKQSYLDFKAISPWKDSDIKALKEVVGYGEMKLTDCLRFHYDMCLLRLPYVWMANMMNKLPILYGILFKRRLKK